MGRSGAGGAGMNALTAIVADEHEFDELPDAETWAPYLREILADTPARCWWKADWNLGRASICRLLGIADEDRIYASYPFRTMLDDDGRAWIAAATGCPSPYALYDAPWLDVTDILLWEPRTGRCYVAGDENGNNLIEPYIYPDALTIYVNPQAFFRDWAAARAKTGRLITKHARGEFVHEVHEPRDGGLPGALVIGKLDKVVSRLLRYPRLRAGSSVNKTELRRALTSAARLPSIAEG